MGRLPRICFVHIPKTAGTSITNYFKKIYGDKACPAYTTDDYKWYTENQLLRYEFYGGHNYYHDRVKMPNNLDLICVFRNPLDRLISLYNYWKNLNSDHISDYNIKDALSIARSKSIYEFTTSLNPFIRESIDGALARQIIRSDLLYLLNEKEISSTSRYLILKSFTEEIAKFKSIITMENIESNFMRLASELNMPNPVLKKENTGSYTSEFDRNQLSSILMIINPIDFEIYEIAKLCEKIKYG